MVQKYLTEFNYSSAAQRRDLCLIEATVQVILYNDPEGVHLRGRLKCIPNAAIWVSMNDCAEMTLSGFLNPYVTTNSN